MDIATLLDNTSHGAARTRVNEKLAELIEAVDEHGGKGAIVLTVKIKRDGRYASVDVSCKATIPEEPIPGQAFFLGKGQLHIDDPKQTTFADVRGLKPVNGQE